ncbi:MAG: glycosyltransferase, partial [Candidatus Gracilibacteria bacterium]
MRVGINASFLRKQNTGIGQVSANFLKKIAEVESSKSKILKGNTEFFIYLEEDVDLKLPESDVLSGVRFHKRIFLPPYKRDDLIRRIWWEKYLLPKKVREDKCDILFSLYQSATSLEKSAKHIMLVHDIIPKLFPQYLNNWRKKIYQKLTEEAIKKTDKIIAISHRTEKDLIRHLGIDAKKITVSYIDVAEIYKKEVSEEESARVLKKYNLEAGYIYNGGGLEVRKNVEGVMRAYKILA